MRLAFCSLLGGNKKACCRTQKCVLYVTGVPMPTSTIAAYVCETLSRLELFYAIVRTFHATVDCFTSFPKGTRVQTGKKTHNTGVSLCRRAVRLGWISPRCSAGSSNRPKVRHDNPLRLPTQNTFIPPQKNKTEIKAECINKVGGEAAV